MTRSSCSATRELLTTSPAAETTPAVAEHLLGCAHCRLYAGRMRGVHRLLKEHHAGLEPDDGFGERVARRMAIPDGVTLGWAALRVLPATLLLLGILAWLWAVDSPSAALEAPTDNLLSWFFEQAETGS